MHLSGLVVALIASPLLAAAGMYRAPVIELDSKSFKEVMSKEHASVSCVQQSERRKEATYSPKRDRLH